MVVLNFWGSWCTVCQQEAPALAVAAQQLKPSGVQFVGVDVEDNTASAKAYVQHYGIAYPSLNDPGDLIAAEFNQRGRMLSCVDERAGCRRCCQPTNPLDRAGIQKLQASSRLHVNHESAQ
jgi:thiol-disulfide isomerase/thioredoxin